MSSGLCRCGKKARPGQRTCLDCHAQWMRTWRKTHRLVGAARARANARSYAHMYIRRGKVDRQPCVFCGKPNADISQPDPSRPLEIIWCCSMCRRRVTREHAHTKVLTASADEEPVVAGSLG